MTTHSQAQGARTCNAATRVVASSLGVLAGIGSIDHGLLECMQGFHPAPGLIVNALGPGNNWTAWKQGGEGAFTLIPNFLVTGMVATLLGLLLIVWSARFLDRPRGPAAFLALSVASFLTGGGVAQVLLFTLAWAVATRIRGSLALWKRFIPRAVRPLLGRFLPWTLAVGTVLLLIALEIAVFGYVPGVSDQTRLLHICWKTLGYALALFILSILSAFARDIEAH